MDGEEGSGKLGRVCQPHTFALQTLSISVPLTCTVPTCDDDGIGGVSKRSATRA